MQVSPQHVIQPDQDSGLPSGLVEAYLATEFRVHPAENQPGFTLRIGVEQPELRSLMKHHNVNSAAYITAWNPLGKQQPDDENRSRQAVLRQALIQRSLAYLSGIGQGTGGDWPGEESFLVLGLDLVAAQRLANEVEQNAFVWAGVDAIPKLVLLR